VREALRDKQITVGELREIVRALKSRSLESRLN
jgi:hypothetical protein